jgi:1-deoxy-D-xylulose 5-phosphate reductoisomerase
LMFGATGSIGMNAEQVAKDEESMRPMTGSWAVYIANCCA